MNKLACELCGEVGVTVIPRWHRRARVRRCWCVTCCGGPDTLGKEWLTVSEWSLFLFRESKRAVGGRRQVEGGG